LWNGIGGGSYVIRVKEVARANWSIAMCGTVLYVGLF